MKKPEITILIPAYNAEKHIEEAVDSVLKQTFENFELIIINDGSKDNTLSIIQTLAEADSRIRIIDQENQGVAESLNRGLRESQTEWALIMHADDIMIENRIERQLRFIDDNPDVKVCSCIAYFINENGRQLGKTSTDVFTREKLAWYKENNEVVGLLHPGVAMHIATVLSVGGYRQAFWPSEDNDLWNRIIEAGHIVLVQNEILMKYRIHSGSVSTSRFIATRMKYEWMRECIIARRNSQLEPDWETFQMKWSQLPWYERFNRNRKTRAKAFYHSAGHDFLDRHYFLGSMKLVASIFLQPVYTIPRLKNQIFSAYK